MPAESKEKREKDKERSVDEQQRRLQSSLNPLKSHFGIDIGLPWPGMHIVRLVIWTLFILLRLLAYTAIGLAVFIIVYGGSVAVYCPFVSTATLQTCLFTEIAQPEYIFGNFLLSLGVVALLIYFDYRVDWRQYL